MHTYIGRVEKSELWRAVRCLSQVVVERIAPALPVSRCVKMYRLIKTFFNQRNVVTGRNVSYFNGQVFFVEGGGYLFYPGCCHI